MSVIEINSRPPTYDYDLEKQKKYLLLWLALTVNNTTTGKRTTVCYSKEEVDAFKAKHSADEADFAYLDVPKLARQFELQLVSVVAIVKSLYEDNRVLLNKMSNLYHDQVAAHLDYGPGDCVSMCNVRVLGKPTLTCPKAGQVFSPTDSKAAAVRVAGRR